MPNRILDIGEQMVFGKKNQQPLEDNGVLPMIILEGYITMIIQEYYWAIMFCQIP